MSRSATRRTAGRRKPGGKAPARGRTRPDGPQTKAPDVSPSSEAPVRDPVTLLDTVIWAVLLLGIYATISTWGHFDFSDLMGYYDLLAVAFLNGQLHIDIRPDQMYVHDLIPFEGRYYLQWGPFPAMLHALARVLHVPLTDRLLCMLAGWLTCLVFLGILVHLQRRYFRESPKFVTQWSLFAFALGTSMPLIAWRGSVYNESIVIGSLCVLSAFFALLKYQQHRSASWAWICGMLLGLAVLSRITLGIYAVGLFVGFLVFERAGKQPLRKMLPHLAAYALPIAMAGALQLAYNHARFGSPWDYGNRYLPTAIGAAAFSPAYVPDNVRHYLLAPIHFTADFPWLRHEGWQPMMKTTRAENMSAIFLASPFVLLGLLCIPAWRRGHALAERDLRVFVLTAAGSSILMFLVLLSFAASARRYMHDFLPVWMILAWVGAAAYASGSDAWKRWRLPAWVVLGLSALIHTHLSFTQTFGWDPPDYNVMRTFAAWSPTARRILPGPNLDREEAIVRNDLGTIHLKTGHYAEAVEELEKAAALMPNEPRIKKNLELAKRWLKMR
jgi:hypothetical protein